MVSSCKALFALSLTVSAGLPLACSNGDGREQNGGSQQNGPGTPDPTGSGTGTGTGAGTGSDAVGEGDQGTGSATIPNGKSLEQCTTEGKAWRAVVSGGSAPTDCTDPLVNWCCTRAEISTRFPSMASQVEEKLKQFIDGEGLVLYHCSQNAAEKKFTFHMAKIGDGTTTYKTVYVSDVFPQGADTKGNCTAVTTEQLKAAGTGTGTSTSTGTGSAAFTDLKPILKAKCGGSNCHDDGGSQPANSQWLNDEAKFKASDSLARIQATTSPMPPANSSALTDDEKAKLVQFLTP